MTTSKALLQSLLLDTYPMNTVSGGGGYTVESLTVSGDLITPATRALGQAQTFTDFLPVDTGYGIWPAYTNKTIQSVPGASATTNVTKGGDVAATLTKVVDALAPVANASGEVWELDNSAGSTDATVDFSGATGATTAHSISIAAKVSSGTPTLMLGTAGSGSTPVSITSTEWPGEAEADNRTRSENITPAANTDVIRVTAPAGCVVRFVAPSLNAGAIALPWRRTAGSSASTTAGRIQMPVADLFTETQGAVFARVMVPWTSEPVTDPGVFTWADSVSNRLELHFDTSTGQQVSIVRAAAGSPDNTSQAYAWAANTGFGAAFAWTASAVKVSANGAAFSSKSSSNIPTLSDTAAELGGRTGVTTGREMSGNILWFATFAGTLTDDDAAALNAFGDTPPTWAQLVGALPATAQVTGLWQAKTNQFFKAA